MGFKLGLVFGSTASSVDRRLALGPELTDSVVDTVNTQSLLFLLVSARFSAPYPIALTRTRNRPHSV